MKKVLLLAAIAAGTLTANAQKGSFSSNKFFDNWSIGINAGATAATHNLGFSPAYEAYQFGDRTATNTRSFWRRARAIAGIEITKQWTPIFATSIQGWADVNTTPSHTFIDRFGGMLLNKVNLSNLFFGYNGKPRFFELQAVAGFGVASHIKPSVKTPFGSNVVTQNGGNLVYSDKNDHFFVTRFGLSFDFNLDKQRAWTLSLKPAIVYNLDGELFQGIRTLNREGVSADINDSELELMAGLTYHFRNSNGEHYFANVREYDQAEVDALNAKINGLRGQISDKDAQINALGSELADLRKKLSDCLNKPAKIEYVDRPVTVTQTETKNTLSLTNNVHFKVGKSTIDASQQPNVERVAIYLKNHPEATVNVLGYASKDGDQEKNERLAEARAQAVKSMLINKYGIAASRINAKGCGVSEAYDDLEWNRVSECTIEAGEK